MARHGMPMVPSTGILADLGAESLESARRVGFPVLIKPAGGGKAVYEKFNLNLEKCPTCKYQEYACICAHSHDDDEKKKK